MQKQWQELSAKFLKITPREQYLVLFSGLIAIFWLGFTLFVEPNFIDLKQQKSTVNQAKQDVNNNEQTIAMLEASLRQDPNVALRQQIKQYENKMQVVDGDLLTLTSGLIDPIQMRHALIELLKLQKGVQLVSFEVLPVEPLLLKSESLENKTAASESDTDELNAKTEQPALGLYRHSIKLKLKGRYFKLRDYLLKLEQLSWTFFWREFQYQLLEYPQSELEIEIYSLSTEREFIGV